MHIFPRRTSRISNKIIKDLAESLKSLEQSYSYQAKLVKNIRNVLKDFDAFLKKNQNTKEKILIPKSKNISENYQSCLLYF